MLRVLSSLWSWESMKNEETHSAIPWHYTTIVHRRPCVSVNVSFDSPEPWRESEEYLTVRLPSPWGCSLSPSGGFFPPSHVLPIVHCVLSLLLSSLQHPDSSLWPLLPPPSLLPICSPLHIPCEASALLIVISLLNYPIHSYSISSSLLIHSSSFSPNRAVSSVSPPPLSFPSPFYLIPLRHGWCMYVPFSCFSLIDCLLFPTVILPLLQYPRVDVQTVIGTTC